MLSLISSANNLFLCSVFYFPALENCHFRKYYGSDKLVHRTLIRLDNLVESLDEITKNLNQLATLYKGPALKCPTPKGTSFPQDFKNK